MIDAPSEPVYETLLDAEAFPRWVVGARHLRGIDPEWPERGARFHHEVGAGPVEVADNTKLVDKQRNQCVVLEARIRPFAIGRISLELGRVDGDRTRVVMTEEVTGGPARPVRALLEPALYLRNAVSLRRLRRLVASRARRH